MPQPQAGIIPEPNANALFLNQLGEAVDVMDEVHGFRYLDSRDLTGFIDGTENPKGKARAAVALIDAEDPAFAGGSYVFTQRYIHNLKQWATVPQPEQEKVIGRKKRDSKELSEKAKPPTAHISRVVIEEQGEELEIVRHSFPYGTVSEAGLFFIAYTKDLSIPEKMLSRMLGTAGDGMHDHLMDHTRGVRRDVFRAVTDCAQVARVPAEPAMKKQHPREFTAQLAAELAALRQEVAVLRSREYRQRR